MNILTRQWISTVFNDGEVTCMGHKFENRTFPVSQLSLEQEEYVSINPMKKGTTRKGSNVTQFRTFLLEMDNYTQKEQIKLILNSKIPWSTMTTSASKSVHFLICLDEALEDRTIYTAYFKAIQKALQKYGAVIDGACKDPGRFTRAPFGINTKKELVERKPDAENRVQKVLKVKDRVKLSDLDEWLRVEGVNPTEFIEVPVIRENLQGVSNAEDDLKWEWVMKYYMKNDEWIQGNHYNYQFKMACQLLRTGMSEDSIRGYFMKEWGHIHENNPVRGAAETVKSGEEIYVPTMEERREYFRQQDIDQQLENNRSGFNRDGIDAEKIDARPEDLDRYLTVGTEYFKIDSTSDKLIPWSKTMFEKFYGRNSIPPLNYDKFGYKPDYVSKSFPYDLNVDRRTRNMFIRPTYQIEEGEWETIEKALQHGFEEQYEMILQYCAILIAFPEAKLPAIWFVGPENKGKSAVIAIFKYLVGEWNTKRISSKQMESDYTDFLGGSQLVVVEEAGGWKNPDAVMGNLKDWVTEKGIQKLNPKYGKQFESPIHAKFIFSSNNYDAIPIEGEATRFWIREVYKEPQHKVSNFYDRIISEMGAFVYYLIKEIVPTLSLDSSGDLSTQRGRLYFDPLDYKTEIKNTLKGLNKSELAEEIESVVMEFFAKYPDEDKCFADLKSLKTRLGRKMSDSSGNKAIKLCLLRDFKIDSPTQLLKRSDSLQWQGEHEDLKQTRSSRWYIFNRKDFFNGEELFQTQYFS